MPETIKWTRKATPEEERLLATRWAIREMAEAITVEPYAEDELLPFGYRREGAFILPPRTAEQERLVAKGSEHRARRAAEATSR